MKDGLYHRDLGLPAGLANLWAGELNLRYSAHAHREGIQDRYGRVPLLLCVAFEAEDVVEVQIEAGEPVKAVLRIPLDDSRDLVYVLLRPANGVAFVKTVWFNSASDTHRTLDASKYIKIIENSACV